MRPWVKKLFDQFAIDWGSQDGHDTAAMDISEERATLLYFLDVYSKHLLEIENHPIRKVRESLDGFAKSIMKPEEDMDKLLFKLRQFFASYRLDEYTYVQHTFDDFKKIVWEFADQLSEDIRVEKVKDLEVEQSLDELREAVESNSIESLRSRSRQFIDFYIKHQAQKDDRRAKRLQSMRRNFSTVKKKLVAANEGMRTDHLTNAFNRKSFDEQLHNYWRLFGIQKSAVSLMLIDIDHFKKINDGYGHDVGDFVLKECVSMVKQMFHRDADFVARIGGEEFGVILPDYDITSAAKKADEVLARIRKEAVVTGSHQIKFTVSIGIAQLQDGESPEQWFKRSDVALYQSKHDGRDRQTVASAVLSTDHHEDLKKALEKPRSA